ncbi:MAG: GDYXXLXY domain-containing protein [Potamolinea sp.]
MTNNSANSTKVWRFWLPILFQTTLILTVPAQAIYTQLTGKTIILQTAPVDPYELLRGYSQTLRYDITNQDNLRKLPGWKELPKQLPNGNKVSFIQPGTQVYVILAESNKPVLNELPQAWKPVAIATKLPTKLPVNQVALKGLAQDGIIKYGLETYYIPEEQKQQINAELRTARETDQNQQTPTPTSTPSQPDANQPQQTPPVVMEIKVNSQGDTVPISLWARVGKAPKQQIRNYRF